jgi:hypothetical protein
VFEVWWKITKEIDMKKYFNLLFFSMILVSPCVFSQEIKTSLVCSGKYNNYTQNIRDVDDNGGIIYIQGSIVKVGIFGFSYSNGDLLDYKILSSTDSKITFKYSGKENTYFGSLNRYTGEITLSETTSSNQFSQLYKGKCVLSKKMF